MPIHVDEVVITLQVADPQAHGAEHGAQRGGAGGSGPARAGGAAVLGLEEAARRRLIEECVQQVLAVLRERQQP